MCCKHMRFLTLEAQSYRCRKFKDDFAKQNCAATQRKDSFLRGKLNSPLHGT
jgi:hypothetical protein